MLLNEPNISYQPNSRTTVHILLIVQVIVIIILINVLIILIVLLIVFIVVLVVIIVLIVLLIIEQFGTLIGNTFDNIFRVESSSFCRVIKGLFKVIICQVSSLSQLEKGLQT